MVRLSGSGDACAGWDNGACTGSPHCPPRCPRFFDREGEPVLVTPLADDDFADLVSMYEALDVSSRTGNLPPMGRDRIVSWLEGLTDSGWNLVARDGDRIVGHVGGMPVSEDRHEFVVFVDDDYQGRGIGTELVEQLVAYAAARGHDALQLSVERDNERAISVYENVSFEVAEQKVATVEMELPLEKPVAEDVRRPPAER